MAKRKPVAWTDKNLRALKPEDKPYEQSFIGMRGLHCRVFPNGNKVLRFQYVDEGKRYRMVIGHFPTDSVKKLSDLYHDAKAKRGQKINIVEQLKIARLEEQAKLQERERENEEAEGRLTFNRLADLYINGYAKLNKKSWREDNRILNKYILPKFGKRHVETIKRAEYTEFLAGLAVDAPVMANRVLACLRGMLNWAMKTGYIEVNHAAGIPRPSGKEKSKERALDKAEIKAFWKLTDTIANASHRDILRLVLLTGQRPSEVSQARWSEFKNEWWTLPAERSKNGNEHRTYLIPQAREILKQIPRHNDFLFPQTLGRKNIKVLDKAIDTGTPAHVLLDTMRATDMERFTVHDLRRTMATQLGELGYMDDQIGLVLNHTRAGVTQRYNRSSHDQPKKEMMMAWSARFDNIMKGKKKAKVVKMA